MNFTLQYREAQESDIDFLLDLRMKTMTEHYASSNLSTTKEFALQRVLYQFEKARIISLNDHQVGLLKIDHAADTVDILQLQIHPDEQGRGIGKSILENIIQEAALSQKTVSLSVLKTNKAQKLYARLGFKIIDEDEHSYMMKLST
ncbi:GNAT family N-acetyltransferase [Chryseobacterium sp. T16E-39]|uniref:GNAT family N-acetyltransferase n=1 Tax=Chryseobacterium sp. T16E-39 TaxID=2015076 RepID=UPI000B5B33E1|nr:GNAT family N-acetyltransferase [Chryseobacterium sp. T16E-39]ASK30441.1 GNAT family N-acetyltransferase [Chryseobacterium sp. T16E-39]